jgi:hypothetical protein
MLQIAPWFLSFRRLPNKLTKYYDQEAHLGLNELSLQVPILKTWHLVEKLSKQLCVGKIIHYEQCLLHFVKIDYTNKCLQRQWITCTKEGIKFSNREIDDFLTLA